MFCSFCNKNKCLKSQEKDNIKLCFSCNRKIEKYKYREVELVGVPKFSLCIYN